MILMTTQKQRPNPNSKLTRQPMQMPHSNNSFSKCSKCSNYKA